MIRGGPLGSDTDARAELLREACALADEHGYSDLRLQTDVPGCEELVSGLRAQADSPAWLTPLPGDPDELLKSWRKQSKNLARNIVKSQQRGVVVRPVGSLTDLWRFYRQYVLTMRRHRAVPRSWLEIRFAHKLLAPSGRCRAWLGEHRGEVVAGAMFLSAGSSFELLYAGSDLRANDVRPTHAVYWHAIEWAIATGKTVVDWGTAPAESSLGKFKAQWGAEPLPSFQYSYAPTAVPQRPRNQPAPADTEDSGGGLWDRIPTDALGIAATISHRLMLVRRKSTHSGVAVGDTTNAAGTTDGGGAIAFVSPGASDELSFVTIAGTARPMP